MPGCSDRDDWAYAAVGCLTAVGGASDSLLRSVSGANGGVEDQALSGYLYNSTKR